MGIITLIAKTLHGKGEYPMMPYIGITIVGENLRKLIQEYVTDG